jgi:hypothetical protein
VYAPSGTLKEKCLQISVFYPIYGIFFCYGTGIELLPSKMQRLSIILVEKKESSRFGTKETTVAGPDFYITPRWRLRCEQAAHWRKSDFNLSYLTLFTFLLACNTSRSEYFP